MIVQISDAQSFMVTAMAVAGETLAADEVTLDMVGEILTMVANWSPRQRFTWVTMLAAESTDEQWAACSRVLRAVAAAPAFVDFERLAAAGDKLRQQPELSEETRSLAARARAQADHEIRIEKGGRLS